MCPESSVQISTSESQLHLQYSDRNIWIVSDVSRILCPDFLIRITVTRTIQWQEYLNCPYNSVNIFSTESQLHLQYSDVKMWLFSDVSRILCPDFFQQNHSYTYSTLTDRNDISVICSDIYHRIIIVLKFNWETFNITCNRCKVFILYRISDWSPFLDITYWQALCRHFKYGMISVGITIH